MNLVNISILSSGTEQLNIYSNPACPYLSAAISRTYLDLSLCVVNDGEYHRPLENHRMS